MAKRSYSVNVYRELRGSCVEVGYIASGCECGSHRKYNCESERSLDLIRDKEELSDGVRDP
jgi:hypothetical protein